MVESSQEYKWSSYGFNALDALDRLLTPHESYLDIKQRRAKYVDLFSEHLDEKTLRTIRNCAQAETPLGETTGESWLFKACKTME